jgi:hypothetical protein
MPAQFIIIHGDPNAPHERNDSSSGEGKRKPVKKLGGKNFPKPPDIKPPDTDQAFRRLIRFQSDRSSSSDKNRTSLDTSILSHL